MKLRGIIINQVSKSPKRSRYSIMIIFFFLWNISMNYEIEENFFILFKNYMIEKLQMTFPDIKYCIVYFTI